MLQRASVLVRSRTSLWRARCVTVATLGSLALLAPSACVAYGDVGCRVGADCASGICNEDGTCGGSGGSTSSSAASGGGSSPDGGACTPTNNGIITRAQVPLQAGLHGTFRSAENATVDTQGTMTSDGTTVWDFTAAASGDHAQSVDTLPLAGQWFASDFTDASYAAQLSDASTLLGIFKITESDLELVGVASPMSGASQTELTYSPPVVVLQFPLQVAATWTTTSSVTGTADGIDVVYTESYENSVDVAGVVKTPYATFNALRVNTALTRVVGALVTTTRTFSFVTDCFGNVASVVSNTDETTVDFTSAAVLSRLAP